MSTDYDIVCDKCKEYIHFGQRYSFGHSLGYGSNDETGHKNIWEFIDDHSSCNEKTGLRLVLNDHINKNESLELYYKDANRGD